MVVHFILSYVSFYFAMFLELFSTEIFFSRFMRALAIQGKSRESLPYKAPFQPWGSWFALVSTVVITLFKGFDTFIPWNAANFVTYVIFEQIDSIQIVDLSYRSYIAVPIFFFMWIGYKIMYRTKSIPLGEVDLITGLRAIDEEEEKYLREEATKGPRTRLQRIWDSL